MGPPCRGLRLDRRSNGARAFLPTPPPPHPHPHPTPPRDRGMSCSRAPCSAGHQQKLEDQTKAFPDRWGAGAACDAGDAQHAQPSSSLSTTSHLGSQAQTPIQGMSPSGDGGWGGQGPGGIRGLGLVPMPQNGSSSEGPDCTALGLNHRVRVPTCLDTHPALRACSARPGLSPSFTQQIDTATSLVPSQCPASSDQCEQADTVPSLPRQELLALREIAIGPPVCLLELDRPVPRA